MCFLKDRKHYLFFQASESKSINKMEIFISNVKQVLKMKKNENGCIMSLFLNCSNNFFFFSSFFESESDVLI